MENKNTFKYSTPGTVQLFFNPNPTSTVRRITKTYTVPPLWDELSERISDTRTFPDKDQKSTPHFSKYKDLFNKLIEDKRKYFTEKYGKNPQDYQKYLLNKTDIYDNENSSAFAYEPKLNIKELLTESLKFKRTSGFSVRQKPKPLKRKFSRISRLSSWRITDHLKFSPGFHHLKPFEYKLSDPEMLRKGITVDTQITARPIKLFIFHPILTNPLISGLFPTTLIEDSKKVYYPNKTLCAVTTPDGRTIVYKNNGARSLAFLPGIRGNFFVVYSPKRRYFDKKLEPFPLAMFDLNGNGVVYDEDGKKRLIYDQAQGILFDSPVKIPIKWKWKTYDTIIMRRESMKFVKPDELLDIDHEEKLKQRAKRELVSKTGRRRKAKKLVHVYTSADSVSQRNTRSTATEDLTDAMPKLYSSSRNVVNAIARTRIDEDFISQLFGIRKFDLSKLRTKVKLKLTKSKCSIEPLLQYCETQLEVNKLDESVKSMDLVEDKQKVSPKKDRTKNKDVRKRTFTDLLLKCFPNTLALPTGLNETVTEIKPIIMKITDSVSLTILNQEHIHIDFYSYPIHFEFEIGITPDSNELKALYSVKNTQEVKEPIPCFFEVMQDKSIEFKAISLKLKQMRDEASVQLEQSHINYMKMWGYNVFRNKR